MAFVYNIVIFLIWVLGNGSAAATSVNETIGSNLHGGLLYAIGLVLVILIQESVRNRG